MLRGSEDSSEVRNSGPGKGTLLPFIRARKSRSPARGSVGCSTVEARHAKRKGRDSLSPEQKPSAPKTRRDRLPVVRDSGNRRERARSRSSNRLIQRRTSPGRDWSGSSEQAPRLERGSPRPVGAGRRPVRARLIC